MSVELRELRTFIHIARVGSFSRAAAELFIAQPALSRQIKKLEDDLGTALLIRHGRGVRLTTAGAALLERAEIITHYVEQTEKQIRANTLNEVPQLAIGVPPALGLLIAPSVIAGYQKTFPDAKISVREGVSSSLQEWLMDHRVDFVLVHNQIPLEGVHIRPLFSESMMLVGPYGDQSTYTIKDLARLPLILPAPPHSNRRLIDITASQIGIAPKVVLEIDSVPITKELIHQGAGYTILAYSAVHDDLRKGRLSAHPLKRPQIRSVVSTMVRKEHKTAQHLQSLHETVVTTLHTLLNTPDWRGETQWLHSDS
ncbi:LysR family transcriptional regulator [Paraburkholderia caribensis]|uniref:LysR family transcriptional regulator n=1 Tax=Paraburkholderia caribensis TaxID=75105 RepID=UPI0007C6EF3B|nr:LysR substrate-binding domain-containing protein [Paraburkholderia caribensis]